MTAVIAAIVMVGVTSAADQSSTPPVTKDQYLQKFFELSTDYSKTNDLYYAIALDRAPARRCSRLVRRYANRLTAIVRKGNAVSPPAEISGTHERLVDVGRRVVRKIRRVSGPVAKGKLVCGGAGSPANGSQKRDPAKRIYDIYSASAADRLIEDLRRKGYLPSGE